MNEGEPARPRRPDFLRYVLIGFLTIAPLWVTWLVFEFILGMLARTGTPLLWTSARAVRPFSSWAADWLLDPSFQYLLGVMFTLLALYLIGWLTSFVVGRKLIAWFEAFVVRLPLVQTVYKITKSVLQTLSKPPVTGQRVVLISFPSREMKTIAFVTRELTDKASGRLLLAVYVPTAPNPTSGYIEIVPFEDVVQTDWTVEEAMTFVVTGGTNGPPGVHFTVPPEGVPPRLDEATDASGGAAVAPAAAGPDAPAGSGAGGAAAGRAVAGGAVAGGAGSAGVGARRTAGAARSGPPDAAGAGAPEPDPARPG